MKLKTGICPLKKQYQIQQPRDIQHPVALYAAIWLTTTSGISHDSRILHSTLFDVANATARAGSPYVGFTASIELEVNDCSHIASRSL